MKILRAGSLLMLVLLVAACLSGCSGGGPTTYKVSGTITHEGQPVADAQIGFIPDGAVEETKPARGQTDSDGRYTLTTYIKPGQESRGAMAASFKVTVTKGIAENRIVEYEDLATQRDLLSPAYADAKTTPLTATVTPGGDNTFDFPLSAAEAQP